MMRQFEKSSESQYLGALSPVMKTFVPPFLPTRMTAPGPPRMLRLQLQLPLNGDIFTPQMVIITCFQCPCFMYDLYMSFFDDNN